MLKRPEVGSDGGPYIFVLVVGGELEQLGRVPQSPVKLDEGVDDALELGPLAPERLGAGGIFPDARILQLPLDLVESLLTSIDVKDTPLAPPGEHACFVCVGRRH